MLPIDLLSSKVSYRLCVVFLNAESTPRGERQRGVVVKRIDKNDQDPVGSTKMFNFRMHTYENNVNKTKLFQGK